jgi:hypothetical protein
MFQAIVTKYIGPTNYRGSRIVAKAAAGRIYVSYDHALNIDDNHLAAARALARKYGWPGEWHGGGMPSGDGNVYVCGDIGGSIAFVTYDDRKRLRLPSC